MRDNEHQGNFQNQKTGRPMIGRRIDGVISKYGLICITCSTDFSLFVHYYCLYSWSISAGNNLMGDLKL